ncbi:MAG: recombination mediator RecR [Candidatus Spechtbacterales bacterium]
MLPKPLQELQQIFEKFPGIGPRQASRFSFFLLKQPPEELERMADAIKSLTKEVGLCNTCYLPASGSTSCVVCSDNKRDNSIIYIVEKESDAIAMEDAKMFNGTYLVLGENISPIGKSDAAKERLRTFLKKVKNENNIKEVVLALNNTREGNFTTMYIEEMFKKNIEGAEVKLTRLGRGLSTGSELEYADEETLRNAFENRR